MKKFILLVLTAALVALPVLSCAADDDNVQPDRPGEPGAAETGEPGEDDLPGLNGGADEEP